MQKVFCDLVYKETEYSLYSIKSLCLWKVPIKHENVMCVCARVCALNTNHIYAIKIWVTKQCSNCNPVWSSRCNHFYSVSVNSYHSVFLLNIVK